MELPKRKPTRLKGYDYSSPGAYFVTICTQNREQIFEIEPVGNALRGVPPEQNKIIHTVGNALCGVPSEPSEPPEQNKIIHKWVKETENKFDNVIIDKYVIMPNHLHFIVVITERHAGRSLHDVIRWFKTMVTNEYIRHVKNGLFKPCNKRLFQRSFHDHIIRGEKDYQKIWEYIDTNPLKWESDCFYAD